MTPLGQFAPPEPHATDRPAGLGLPGQAVREALDSVLRRRDNDIAAFYRLARLGYWRRVVASNDITWSEEMYRIFGCDPKHKVPTYTGHKHLYTPASYAALQKAVAHAIDYGMPYEIDLEIRRPDGSTRWITAHGEAEAFEHGRASILRGTVQDITARKTAEARLALSESRYRSLVKASAVIVWITDADGAQQSTLPEWQAFTGQTDEEVKEYGWANAIHPDDYDRTLRSWRESVARGELHETEHRLRRHDGAYRCMAVRAAPVRDPSGKIVEWVGMHTDITEKKAAEAALRQAEIAALATSIVASSPFATIVAGWDGVISAVNPAAQRMLGYDKAELVGQATPLLFLHPDDLVSRAAALTDILQMPITPDHRRADRQSEARHGGGIGVAPATQRRRVVRCTPHHLPAHLHQRRSGGADPVCGRPDGAQAHRRHHRPSGTSRHADRPGQSQPAARQAANRAGTRAARRDEGRAANDRPG